MKEEPSIRLGLNDLSPASVASEALDVTIGPVGPLQKPLEGPKLGDTLVGAENGRESEDPLVADSPPLVSLRSAASVARRPSQPRPSRSSGRQLKLHSLTFAPKVNLGRQPPRKSAGAAHLQVRRKFERKVFFLCAYNSSTSPYCHAFINNKK